MLPLVRRRAGGENVDREQVGARAVNVRGKWGDGTLDTGVVGRCEPEAVTTAENRHAEKVRADEQKEVAGLEVVLVRNAAVPGKRRDGTLDFDVEGRRNLEVGGAEGHHDAETHDGEEVAALVDVPVCVAAVPGERRDGTLDVGLVGRCVLEVGGAEGDHGAEKVDAHEGKEVAELEDVLVCVAAVPDERQGTFDVGVVGRCGQEVGEAEGEHDAEKVEAPEGKDVAALGDVLVVVCRRCCRPHGATRGKTTAC